MPDRLEIVQKLYQASQAGVRIDLLVRGICCLRPASPCQREHPVKSIWIGSRTLRLYYSTTAAIGNLFGKRGLDAAYFKSGRKSSTDKNTALRPGSWTRS